ncbi:hypothetical protein NPIL_625061 [Nephila pilipes]|uniref:Uncharacterized protein n=1 Tax=Nephila pilipes TaxID=299642 RepID=A0A8X6ML08_NEPPI|nr:hypothetical protein NPIL_625061 [Nephila pilipes]
MNLKRAAMRPAFVGMVLAILTNCCSSLYKVWHFLLFNTVKGSSILRLVDVVSGLLGKGGNSSELTIEGVGLWASWSGVDVAARCLHLLITGAVVAFGLGG